MQPRTNYKNELDGAQLEIMSAMSSLNMEPKLIENPKEGAFYLSELDFYAAHSMEHMFAAMDLIQKATTHYNTILRECEFILNDHDISPSLEQLKEWNFEIPNEWIIENFIKFRKSLK